MRSRIIVGALAVAFTASFTACGSSDTTVAAPSVKYISTLSGANEIGTPTRITQATGTATYTLTGNILTYSVTVTGLTAAASASHIHAAPAGVNGNVVVPYVTAAITSGVVASGTVDLSLPIQNGTTSITGDSLRVLLNNGSAYTNVHTSTYPGGEIRGQIIKQ
ncbi:MAG: CHRD domain-containing protein [bacterium]